MEILRGNLSQEIEESDDNNDEVIRSSIKAVGRRGLFNNLLDALNGQLRPRFVKSIVRFLKSIVRVESNWEFDTPSSIQENADGIRRWPQLFLPLYGEKWSPKMVGDIVAREAYTGKAYYKRVSNPNKPLGDLTMQIKRTLTRPKLESDRVQFEVPALTTYELWQKANSTLRERGRGRGKQGKKIQALFRARLFCPICGKPMAVARRRSSRIYYYYRARYSEWLEDPCPYSRFVPATWDNEIWQEICEMLKNDLWIEQQLAV